MTRLSDNTLSTTVHHLHRVTAKLEKEYPGSAEAEAAREWLDEYEDSLNPPTPSEVLPSYES